MGPAVIRTELLFIQTLVCLKGCPFALPITLKNKISASDS
jgi:hypothetical protein